MNRKINILTVFIVSISMLLLSGCSEKVSLSSYKSIKSNSTEDIVISGAKYSMQWDSGKKVIILKDNVTGLVWSTTPETALNNNIAESGKKNNPQTESALLVTYYDTEKYIQNTLISASDAIKYGKVYAKKTAENTISVMYDFSKAEITVVVEYKLTADGISIQIDPKRISEGKKKLVTNIALAPFACAVDNNSDDSYVFVPSGSGALIYSNNKRSVHGIPKNNFRRIYKNIAKVSIESVKLFKLYNNARERLSRFKYLIPLDSIETEEIKKGDED